MVLRERGPFVGSVSGGCVEADLVERARGVFAGEAASVVHYGVADAEAWEVGLSCGGEIDVWLELADPLLWREVAGLLDDGEVRDARDRARRPGAKRLERGVLEQTAPARGRHVFVEGVEGPLRGRHLRRG